MSEAEHARRHTAEQSTRLDDPVASGGRAGAAPQRGLGAADRLGRQRIDVARRDTSALRVALEAARAALTSNDPRERRMLARRAGFKLEDAQRALTEARRYLAMAPELQAEYDEVAAALAPFVDEVAAVKAQAIPPVDRAATRAAATTDAPAAYDEADRGTLDPDVSAETSDAPAPDVDRSQPRAPATTDPAPVYDEGRDTLDVQRKASGAASAEDVHGIAAAGVATASSPLPHLDAIQASFGGHDVTHVRAAIGGDAAAASDAIGAEAYATGDRVAFREAPSLHTAAHEAAHVVQQRAGVHLKGGVGESGDAYEQHADAVADAVVRGASAETLLGPVTGSSNAHDGALQRKASADESYTYVGDEGKRRGSNGDWKNLEFEKVVPGTLSPEVGMPVNLLRSVRGRVKWVTEKADEETTARAMAIKDAKQKEPAGTVAGPEVAALYEWLEQQGHAVRNVVQAWALLEGPVDAGILDDEFNIRSEDAIDRMLERLALAGRMDSYDEKDHSREVLRDARGLIESELDIGDHVARLRELDIRNTALAHKLEAAEHAIEAFDLSESADAAEGQRASVEKRKEDALKWINLGIDVTTSFGSGARGVLTVVGVGTEKSKHGWFDVGSSSLGVVKSIASLATDLAYAGELAALDQKIGALKVQAGAAKRAELESTLSGLQGELHGVHDLASDLAGATDAVLLQRQAALSGLGATAADALGAMAPSAPPASARATANDSYGAGDPDSKQRIQTLFANLAEFESINVLIGPANMPTLTGEIPLSGFLHNFRYKGASNSAQSIPGEVGVEAAKLRWWSERAAKIGELADRMKAAITQISQAPKSGRGER